MTSGTVPMLAPDGSSGDIPADRAQDALAAGFKRAVVMHSPDGQIGYVPVERAQEALKAGFKVGQNISELDNPTPKLGVMDTLKGVGGKLVDMGVGAVKMAGDLSNPALVAVNAPKIANQMATSAVSAYKATPQDRYRTPIEPVAMAAGAALGADTPKLADAVRRQDLGGAIVESTPLVAQAAAPFATRATAPLIRGAAKGGGAIVDLLRGASDKTFAPGTPSELMTRAIRPPVTSPELETAMSNQMGTTYAKGQATGNPTNSLQAYMDAVERAKADKAAQYESVLSPNRNVSIDTTPVADAQMRSIPATDLVENPNILLKTAEKAKTYRGNMSLDRADSIRIDTNAKLDAFWEKNAGDKNAARSNPEVARTEAVNNTIRDLVYDELQQRTGVDPRPIQKAYGELSEIDNAANKRGVVYGRQNPTSLAEELGAAEKGVKGFITAKMLKTYKNPSTLIRIAYERWAEQNGITPSWKVKTPLRPNLRPASKVATGAALLSGQRTSD